MARRKKTYIDEEIDTNFDESYEDIQEQQQEDKEPEVALVEEIADVKATPAKIVTPKAPKVTKIQKSDKKKKALNKDGVPRRLVFPTAANIRG